MGERGNRQEREGHQSLDQGAETAQDQIRTIEVIGQAEFTAQFAYPQDGPWWPSVDEVEDKLGGGQDQDEQALHGIEGLDAHIFDIEALLLVKAITVLNARAQSPILIHLADIIDGE